MKERREAVVAIQRNGEFATTLAGVEQAKRSSHTRQPRVDAAFSWLRVN
ncbi:hypothetical protein [Bradyrhizobium sp. CCBAU 51753]|nr:hypothetical protein [Bradyrhizobium sp. CCBAU 51753]